MADQITVSKPGNEALAKQVMSRFDTLKSERDSFYMPAWQAAAQWLAPRKSSILNYSEKSAGDAGWVDSLYDQTGMKASERLAAWLMTNTSPANARWIAFTSGPRSRRRLGNSRGPVDQWWQHVTEVTLEQLQSSNFYTEKHEALLDRNIFGTCSVGALKGRRSAVNFRAIEVGTYVIGVDEEGYVDTVIREFKLNARQAAKQFGVEALGPIVKQAFGDPQSATKTFTFYHSVAPNTERDPQYDDNLNKKFRSCYVCKEDQCVVQEGGYDEMPYAVSRFLKWTGDCWGWAPAFTALPTVRKVNFDKMQESALLELAAFPPMAEPDSLAGQLDMRAGGRNVVEGPNIAESMPRPLYQADVRAIQAIQLSIQEDRDFIDKAFFGDVIAMFSNLEREVTAFEASQLMGEKLDVFSPYYFRLINELDTPLLERTFSILLEGGFYDEPPAELLQDNGDGTATIDLPEVVYLSRLALAVQAHEIASFDALIQRAQLLASIDPSIAAQFLKPMDLERASRGMQKNLGLPTSWQRTPEELAEINEAEAAAAEAAQAAEVVPPMAKAAKDMDSMSQQGKQGMAKALGAG